MSYARLPDRLRRFVEVVNSGDTESFLAFLTTGEKSGYGANYTSGLHCHVSCLLANSLSAAFKRLSR